jgi:hypothetical protein
MQERKFYPMITKTMNNLLRLVDPYDMWEIVDIICSYPKYELDGELAAKPIVDAIIDELNRQYARWNKGDVK